MSDPTPLTWDHCLASLGLLLGPLMLVLALGWPLVAGTPHLRRWGTLAAFLVLTLAGSLVYSSSTQMSRRYQPASYRAHYVLHGGQVATWGNYLVEIARDVAGEYRLWVADAYRRPISAQYYGGRIIPDPEGAAVELESSLDLSYAFAKLPRKLAVVRLELDLPHQRLYLRFGFDGTRRPSALPEWCVPSQPPRPKSGRDD